MQKGNRPVNKEEMSAYQNNKGKAGERQVCSLLKSYGIPARRISMNETNHEDKGDILIADVWPAQVKLGKQVPTFVYNALEHERLAFLRRDREKWVVVVDAKYFIKEFLGGTDEGKAV